MPMSAKKVDEAMRFLMTVAKNPPSSGYKPHASYSDFCVRFNLAPPYKNRVLDLFLLEIVKECRRRGVPDLAALVIHDPESGQREGPGDGWYEAHGLFPGDVPKWRERYQAVLAYKWGAADSA